jgi:hypothetical protein
MAKRTRLERAAAAAQLFAPEDTANDGVRRYDFGQGWLVGHQAGSRDTQRRLARKFKQGLRLGFST